jgi:hypothetical protein
MDLKKASILVICLVACFCTGCTDKDGKDVAGVTKSEELTVAITSPQIGAVLSGDKMVSFECEAGGGAGPYSYRWSSNINGQLASAKSFSKRPSELSKGSHTIIVKVTDSSGREAQGSVFVRVL